MKKIETPTCYLREANDDPVLAAQLWALDWKRAAIDRCAERNELAQIVIDWFGLLPDALDIEWPTTVSSETATHMSGLSPKTFSLGKDIVAVYKLNNKVVGVAKIIDGERVNVAV